MIHNYLGWTIMSLVSCPECQKEVSTRALACPQCAFPFPGKQNGTNGQNKLKLCACPDCGCPVSRQAQTCPHCGLRLKGEEESSPVNGHALEETWLCTHCGTPYTKKVAKPKESGQVSQAGMAPPRPRSPLWQASTLPAKVDKEVVVPRYRRSKKRPIIVGFIIFVLVAASIAVGAIWKFQGLNPLEALVYWRM